MSKDVINWELEEWVDFHTPERVLRGYPEGGTTRDPVLT